MALFARVIVIFGGSLPVRIPDGVGRGARAGRVRGPLRRPGTDPVGYCPHLGCDPRPDANGARPRAAGLGVGRGPRSIPAADPLVRGYWNGDRPRHWDAIPRCCDAQLPGASGSIGHYRGCGAARAGSAVRAGRSGNSRPCISWSCSSGGGSSPRPCGSRARRHRSRRMRIASGKRRSLNSSESPRAA